METNRIIQIALRAASLTLGGWLGVAGVYWTQWHCMPKVPELAIVLVLSIAAAPLLANRNGKREEIVTPPNVDLNSVAPAVLDLIRSKRKLNAIKVYREQTGVGLKEAKDAVDWMESQMRTSTIVGSGQIHATDSTDTTAIRALLGQGRKIEAIKLYRKQFRVGLLEAKDAIERMDHE